MIILFCNNFTARATHIVGGGFDIVWLHDSTYELHLRMLRDCSSNTQFDDPIYVGIFDLGTDARMQIITMNKSSVVSLNFISTKCSGSAPPNCVEVGYYSKVIKLAPQLYNNNLGYYFSWERCCRNKIIQNIINPESAGMTFYMEIPPPKLIRNSSPKWNNNPKTLLCNKNPFTYNFNFVDPDGDSLVYSLVNPIQGNQDQIYPSNNGVPKQAPYPLVTWASGFDNANQIIGSPSLSINSRTGQLNVTPDVSPGVYVSAIRVEEYRFGKKLGEVQLELEYTIIDCVNDPPPVISFIDSNSVKMNGNKFTIQIPQKLCFKIVTTNPQDSLFVTINGNILDSNMANKPIVLRRDTGNFITTTTFCWQTTCSMTGLPPQKFTVSVTDNGCPLPKTTTATFTITLVPVPLINPTRILCMTLINNNETIISWGDSTGLINPNFYKYNLYRNKNNSPYTVIDTILDKKIREFDDKNTPDYTLNNYNYFMRGVNICRFEGPPSDTMGTFDQLKFIPEQQKIKTVTVEENNYLKILWPPTKEKDFAQYFLYKTIRNDSNFKLVTNFLNKYDTVFYDHNVKVDNTSYCYQLVMKDTCGNIGPNGKPSCSIVLKGVSDPFEHRLTWLPYNYWDNGTQNYNLFRMDTENPYSKYAEINSTTTKFVDDHLNYESGKYNYYVEAIENLSDSASYFNAVSKSNQIELFQAPKVYIPNAFTDNDDSLNDAWSIHHVFVKDYSLKIYNRWGQLVFESNDKNTHWKGEGISGNKEQVDVYVYVITYTGWEDSFHLEKGNVTLLR